MSDTCSLFPLFGDPWASCLLPSQKHSRWWGIELELDHTGDLQAIAQALKVIEEFWISVLCSLGKRKVLKYSWYMVSPLNDCKIRHNWIYTQIALTLICLLGTKLALLNYASPIFTNQIFIINYHTTSNLFFYSSVCFHLPTVCCSQVASSSFKASTATGTHCEMIYSYLFLSNAFKQASSVFWRDTSKRHEICFIFQFWISYDIQFQKLLCLHLISQNLLEFWLLCFWKVVAQPRKGARILGLWRSRIQSRARDEAWLLRAFVQ